ncbi:hypothetical protein ABW20_dc0106830 [Dactylellina cionopaga]|nr:hypothetical protein ABW20_dc0106830 [Dactylellina cionopaga]
MASIKAIEGRSVHQIQSGQVISDGLCSAVKELVENSIDAHATSMEIRFKNHGLDLIEVSDNGDGITPDNFDKLALKHYTSKLRTYEDLEQVTTYGFRGEALSSLCALSTLSVATATADVAPKGTKLEFHTSGVLKSTSVTSHPRGTTVSIETLFKSLPVRKQELERNIKREFARVVSFLQAYAIVCVGVKFTVYNHPPNGKKTLLFSTKANKTTKENIANVFGAKALANLIPLDLDFEMTASVSVLHRNRDDTRKVKIVGHISRPVFGEGRQAPDRQLFFVNSRPCNLPQVARAINEVYKSYNLTQSPFVFADLQLDTTAYDVNVSPDKRTILLHDQASLLESLKTSLTELFDNQDQTVPAAAQSKLGAFKPVVASEPAKIPAKRSIQVSEDEDEDRDEVSESSAAIEAPIPEFESEELESSTGSGFSSLVPKLHHTGPIDRSNPDSRKKAKNGLTYEQKGKVAKAFASRPSSRMGDGEGDEMVPAFSGELSELASTAVRDEGEEEEEEIEAHPFSQASPKPWKRSSPAPTTITIGNRTVTSTPKRTPSKAFPIFPSSSPSRRAAAARNPKNSFAKKLRGFGAPGTQSSLSVPEDDIEEPDEEVAPVTQKEASQDVLIEEEEEVESRNNESAQGSVIPTSQSVVHLPREREEDDEFAGILDGDDETEIDQIEKQSDRTIRDEQTPKASTRTVPRSSPPPRRFEAPIYPILNTDNSVFNEENGTEEQHRERERRNVDELIARAERPPDRSATAQQARTTAFARTGLGDSTHCLVQTLRPYTIDNIRTLSVTLRSQVRGDLEIYSNNRSGDDQNSTKGKGKAKGPATLVKLDSGEEKLKVEERLSLTIAKTDFGKMRIAGQFNLGFILATRRSEKGREDDVNDLFIIDQHASDEKYNFERLQAETVVQNQPLVRPKVLELSAMDELVVMDNIDVLKKNGFVVEIDDEGDVGKRCSLVSLPMSKDKVFDLRDFEELLHLIREHPNDSSVRPSKVRAMFAMRACRSSIMIGRTLGLKEMKRVVKHMGELDKPWNCPHGRPTMRHLCDVGQFECWREDMESAFADSDEFVTTNEGEEDETVVDGEVEDEEDPEYMNEDAEEMDEDE